MATKSGIAALLIEDNPSDAQMFEILIEAAAPDTFNLWHTERFYEALKAIENNPFDVVLLDLSLPDGTGLDLVRKIKTCSPQTAIVVVTGNQDQKTAIAALKEGAQDYLVKSDTFSPNRLQKLGYIDVGKLLIKTLRYAIERAELTQQLAISQERYALAVEGANDGVWDWDLRAKRIFYSDRWKLMMGLADADISDSPNEWLSLIHPDDLSRFRQQLKAHLQSQDSPISQKCQLQFYCEYRVRHSDGEYRWMLTRGKALRDESGRAYRFAGSQTDMTQRKLLETELCREKELAQITLHSIGDAVITTDEHGFIKDFNPVAERLTGWTATEARGHPISQVCTIIDSSTRQQLSNPAIQAVTKGQTVSFSNHPILVSKTGEEFAIGDSAAPIRSPDGNIVGTVLIFHDVTEERGRAKQLAWQASHDSLTHLFNRPKFIKSVEEAIADAQTNDSHHVLCYMDLDHFKAVNDTCGHAAGDQLLKQVANLWGSKIRTSDILARLGGDEFGLLLYNCDLERSLEITNSFCESIQSFRFLYDNKIFHIGVSVGVVPISASSTSTEDVLKLADSTCYSAKNKGRNRVQIYYPNDGDIARQSEDSRWFSRITQALDEDQFCLHMQTIAATQTGSNKLNLCEILLRMKDAVSGRLIPPMAFLPPAERYNLMPRIDRWVITHFLQHLSNHAPIPNTVYSINLSGSSINDDTFVDFLKQQLQQHPINPSILCFEITETMAIANLQKAADFILELKKLGCYFALDDFGSGMSSFTYLKHLPVDYLKIDGNFVKGAPNDAIICAMLEAINQVGHVMGLETIAEYVEDQAILDKVSELGIDFVQGYQINRPHPLIAHPPRCEAVVGVGRSHRKIA